MKLQGICPRPVMITMKNENRTLFRRTCTFTVPVRQFCMNFARACKGTRFQGSWLHGCSRPFGYICWKACHKRYKRACCAGNRGSACLPQSHAARSDKIRAGCALRPCHGVQSLGFFKQGFFTRRIARSISVSNRSNQPKVLVQGHVTDWRCILVLSKHHAVDLNAVVKY